jgi:hypothetical protein
MIRKITPLLIGLLLIIPIFSVTIAQNQCVNQTVILNESNDTAIEEEISENLSITLKPMFSFFGVKIIIKNCGSNSLNNIEWTFNTSGGIFIRGGKGSGTKEIIKPNRRAVIRLLPIPLLRKSSPVGIGYVELEATAKASSGDFVRTTAEASVVGRKTMFFRDQGNTAKYRVMFNATWSEDTHPDDFPSNPHFSGLIGASHNDQVNFWREGELASSGIKNMAEIGSKSLLNREIFLSIIKQSAFKLLSGDGIGTSPSFVNLTFKISEDYPLVTLVSMIAPSPDWFVGVESLNLYENDDFVDEKTVVLYAYDAGTDSGTNYTSPNEPTDPQEPIFKIETSPFKYDDVVIPVGTFTFTKI